MWARTSSNRASRLSASHVGGAGSGGGVTRLAEVALRRCQDGMSSRWRSCRLPPLGKRRTTSALVPSLAQRARCVTTLTDRSDTADLVTAGPATPRRRQAAARGPATVTPAACGGWPARSRPPSRRTPRRPRTGRPGRRCRSSSTKSAAITRPTQRWKIVVTASADITHCWTRGQPRRPPRGRGVVAAPWGRSGAGPGAAAAAGPAHRPDVTDRGAAARGRRCRADGQLVEVRDVQPEPGVTADPATSHGPIPWATLCSE